jgi:RNA 3'-terminal phosphate cyclase
MKQLKTIKKFEFDSAHYRLDDGNGDAVTLNVDYKNNQYRISAAGEPGNQAFRQEIAEVAADLLSRKHGVNFANKP